MAVLEKPVLPKTCYDTLMVCIHCGTSVIVWPSHVYGLRYISGNTANILSCSEVVLMLIPQYTILSSIHPGNRNWIEVVGVFLVLFGSSLESVVELWKDK